MGEGRRKRKFVKPIEDVIVAARLNKLDEREAQALAVYEKWMKRPDMTVRRLVTEALIALGGKELPTTLDDLMNEIVALRAMLQNATVSAPVPAPKPSRAKKKTDDAERKGVSNLLKAFGRD